MMKDHVARIRDSSSFPAFSFFTKPPRLDRRPTFSRPPAVARVCVSRPSCARASTADTSSAPRRNHETRRALSDSSCKTALEERVERLLQTAGRCSRAPPRTTAEDRERRDRDRADGVVRPRRRRRRRRTTPSSASRRVRRPAPQSPRDEKRFSRSEAYARDGDGDDDDARFGPGRAGARATTSRVRLSPLAAFDRARVGQRVSVSARQSARRRRGRGRPRSSHFNHFEISKCAKILVLRRPRRAP